MGSRLVGQGFGSAGLVTRGRTAGTCSVPLTTSVHAQHLPDHRSKSFRAAAVSAACSAWTLLPPSCGLTRPPAPLAPLAGRMVSHSPLPTWRALLISRRVCKAIRMDESLRCCPRSSPIVPILRGVRGTGELPSISSTKVRTEPDAARPDISFLRPWGEWTVCADGAEATGVTATPVACVTEDKDK
jgi:hypothetical protein